MATFKKTARVCLKMATLLFHGLKIWVEMFHIPSNKL